MVWKDFMGRVIQVGDDVIISEQNKLHTGIVLGMNDDILTVRYNWFKGEKEYEEETWFTGVLTPDGIVESLYILERK